MMIIIIYHNLVLITSYVIYNKINKCLSTLVVSFLNKVLRISKYYLTNGSVV